MTFSEYLAAAAQRRGCHAQFECDGQTEVLREMVGMLRSRTTVTVWQEKAISSAVQTLMHVSYETKLEFAPKLTGWLLECDASESPYPAAVVLTADALLVDVDARLTTGRDKGWTWIPEPNGGRHRYRQTTRYMETPPATIYVLKPAGCGEHDFHPRWSVSPEWLMRDLARNFQ